ncbi:molybdopterin-dependent oxidoreductase [Amycolatopsis nigrescens]|uniref:molybdopterin-dependent oxidoreductase n=1 Tax=Amycolatopsis nigrescens TaxID=381445 RepID=UPI0003A7E631|nr:molybdopterin-dependent oxidoreductase [Amycolatopsis nigrescens]
MNASAARTDNRPPRLGAAVAALVGVLALAAALAAGHLLAAFLGPNASPFLAVGNGAIDLTPVELKDFAVRTFGTYDKLVLLSGMAVTMLLAAAVAGLLSRRHALPGLVVIGLFGAVGVFAVYNRPDLGAVALLAPVASLVAGVLVFRWLHRRALAALTDRSPEPADAAVAPNRRSFLVAGAGVAVGAGVAGLAGQLVGSGKDVAGSRAAVGKLVPARTAPPIPADADFAKLGTPPFITSNRDFYRVDTALVVPQVTTEDWSLRIHGMVDRELTFGYQDIRGRPLVERTITMTCVSNEVGGPYISTANFIGVELADLLAEAGVRPGAEQLFCTSVDGWNSGTPVAAAMDHGRGAMLAIGMNGEPLPVEHGFPARMVVPGLYGYVSATKWVTDIEVTTWRARQAYWLKRSWAEQAPIKTQSRIDSPKGFENVSGGKVRVSGVAWAQHTGIAAVEVRVDQGPWQRATLSAEVNKDTWRMWWTELDVPPGTHQVSCRATDQSGATQTDRRAGTVPDGATGWHTVSFNAG